MRTSRQNIPILTGAKIDSSSIKISWSFLSGQGNDEHTNFEFKEYDPVSDEWIVLATSGTSYALVPKFDKYGWAKYGMVVKTDEGTASRLIMYDGATFQTY
ncbi:hypothetical protein AGMMS50262_17670 [Bacteroidia bacterium]|nr:hypothetical protein AGMMS50262_17670 [Bacteroidia bacterium]